MNTKLNQRIAALAFNLGLILSSFMAADVLAAECGQAKLITAGSAGVKVTKNTCQEPSKIDVGSVLELSAGSRMWLKFNPTSRGEAVQVICQNKSSEIVKVQVANTSDPWIKAGNLKNCNQWKNNKLICEGADGEKNGFFCAVAKAKAETLLASSPQASTSVKMKDARPEVTTSVKMRSITPVVVAVDVEDIVTSIQPDIELCKSLYNVTDKVEMSWTVSLGKIQDLLVNSENKDLVSCVEDVVKQANANQDVSIQHAF